MRLQSACASTLTKNHVKGKLFRRPDTSAPFERLQMHIISTLTRLYKHFSHMRGMSFTKTNSLLRVDRTQHPPASQMFLHVYSVSFGLRLISDQWTPLALWETRYVTLTSWTCFHRLVTMRLCYKSPLRPLEHHIHIQLHLIVLTAPLLHSGALVRSTSTRRILHAF